MIDRQLLACTARKFGSRLTLTAVAGVLIVAAMVALPLVTLAQTPGAPPTSPQNLSGSVQHDSVSLSWDDPSDPSITGYQILRRDRAVHAAGEFHPIVDDTGSSGTSYVDFTVQAGAKYVYRVKARNAAGLSAWSDFFRANTPSGPIQGVPAQPSRPEVTEAAHNTATISWADPGDSSITGYQVLRRKRGADGLGVFEIVKDDTGSTTSYTDGSVVASTEYGYRVRARNAQGLSERSASVAVDTSAAPTVEESRAAGIQPRSSHVLSALSLSSGTLRPTFAPTTTEYRAAVQYHVSQVTVTATAASGVTVDYLDSADLTLADADTNATGHQVDLAVGETVFKVKVTSGTDDETYTVTVERDSARLFGWTPTRDINALEAAGNASPQGIWSDAATMWVADDDDEKLYAYTLATGARDTSKELNLHADNDDPRGIWSDDTTIWVADDDDDKLYAYTLSSGARDTSKEFSLHADNGDPAGIWSDGATIWVANNKSISVSPYKVFAYTLSGGARDTAKEFVPHWNPVGMWSQGTTMWVVSHVGVNVGSRVDAYTIDLNSDGSAGLIHGRSEPDKQFLLRSPDGTSPVGIWSDGNGTVWVTDPDSPKVESHRMLPFSAGSTTLSALTINDGASDTTLRPAFAATTLAYGISVTDDVNRVTISATPSENSSTVVYLDAEGEALEDAVSNILGFQVNVAVGETLIQILVTAMDGTALIHSVVVERDSTLPGGWTPTKDVVDLDPVALDYLRGIWSDGTTMWVTNNNFVTSGIYAYSLATSARDTSREFSLDAANASPGGIWSNGTTIWVVDLDVSQAKLYAYTLSGGARDATKDIDLHADNLRPMGIWSDGTTVWITDTDATNGGLYAYTLANGGRDTSKEFDLTANSANTAIGGIWSDGTIVWVADTQARKLFAYVKDTGDPDAGRDIILSQAFPLGVWGQGSTIWVVDPGPKFSGVPARLHRIFSYRKPPSSPSDVTLSNLNLSPSPLLPSFTPNLRPAFSYTRATYRVAVPNKASRVTVNATRNNNTTMVAYLDANGDALVDADPNATGFQVDVAVGETSIAIRLAAAGTALTYIVVVERDSTARYGWTPTKDLNNLLLDNAPLAGDSIRGAWADSTTLYVLPHTEPQVFAYTRASGARDESRDIATNPSSIQNNSTYKSGVWSDGTTMWVLNYGAGEDEHGTFVFDGSGKIFAYALSDGVRDTTREFPLHLDTTWAARGIWSDGTTVWVSDWKAAKLFAYTLADGAPAPDSDITLHLLNDSAQGIWSDGTTIWVAQWNSLKFFAYTLATGAYDPDKDFDRVPGNLYPRDIWSDGTTLYVPEHFNKKLFAYNMTDNAPPVFDDGASTTREFAETAGSTPQATASPVGRPVAASDAEDDPLEYSLESTDAGKFTIDPGTGQIRTKVGEVYDYEAKRRYAVVAKVVDDNGGSDTINVTLEVEDSLELPGTVSQPTITTLGPTSLEVNWTAPENAGRPTIIGYDVRWQVFGVGGGSVQRVTGTSATLTGLEPDTQYFIEVRAVNSDGPALAWSPGKVGRTAPPPTPEVRFRSPSYTAIEGVGSATVTVELSVAASQRVTILVTELGQGGATAADWSGVPASVTFAIGETEQTFSVMAVSDSVDDDGESVRLGFGPLPSGVALGSPATATVALVQDADVSTWYVWFGESAYTVTEGGMGQITLHLNAPWKPALNEALTVPLFTPQHQGGASADDYSGVPESVTFYPGQTETSFTVRATDDSDDDDYESVLLPFRNLFPDDLEVGRYGPGSTTLHIADNDGEQPVTVSFEEANYTAEEGGTVATVRLRLDAAPGRTVTIPLTTTTTNRGATSGDYSGVPLSVTFGASETVKNFSLTATDDLANDDFESVVLGFGPLPSRVSAGSPSQAVVNLTDNDGGVASVTVNFGAWAGAKRDGVEEGGGYFLNFRLDRNPGQQLTIPLTYEYLDGATADDFSDLPASVTFPKGNRSAGVVLPVVYDYVYDPGERLRVSFGTLPSGVRVGSYSGPSTIIPLIDNNGPPGLSVEDVSATEWPNPVSCLIFEVRLDRPIEHEVRVDYTTVNGTAVAGQDYTAVSGTMVFRPGQKTWRLCVKVTDDTEDEGTEEMTLHLSNPVRAYLADWTATGYINDSNRT